MHSLLAHCKKALASRWLLPNADALHRRTFRHRRWQYELFVEDTCSRGKYARSRARQKRIHLFYFFLVECIVLWRADVHSQGTHTNSLYPAMVSEKFSWKFFSLFIMISIMIIILFSVVIVRCWRKSANIMCDAASRCLAQLMPCVCVCVCRRRAKTWEPFWERKIFNSIRSAVPHNIHSFVHTFHYSQWQSEAGNMRM